jgi:hypothetical protein
LKKQPLAEPEKTKAIYRACGNLDYHGFSAFEDKRIALPGDNA